MTQKAVCPGRSPASCETRAAAGESPELARLVGEMTRALDSAGGAMGEGAAGATIAALRRQGERL